MKESKDSKTLVFALKSMIKNADASLSHDGYLLFPDKIRSETFMKMAESIKDPKQKAGAYEEHGYVRVSDYISSRVHEQKHYFVRDVENVSTDEINASTSGEPDAISGVQELSSINSTPTSSASGDSLVDSVKEMERLEEIESNQTPAANPSFKP